MRLFFQASALLLAIAVFPLPTNTGIALSTYSLQDILSKRDQLTPAPAATSPAAQVSRAAGAPAQDLAAARARVAVATTAVSAASAGGVTIEQKDIIEAKAEPVPEQRQAAQGEPSLTRTRPIRPQAVISTDFEKNGLSEASFRTVARLNGAEQPPEERILVIGDSLSIPLGKGLESYFSQLPGIHFKRLGRVSSGLARPDFFDWEKNVASLAASMKPSTVVIMIGTNDNQTMRREDGSSARFGTKAWSAEYERRMNRLFELLESRNPDVNIFWVGAPIMESEDLARDVKAINAAIGELCEAKANCQFIDTWDVLADDKGRFADFLVDNTGERVRVRAGDGVHLSHSGARMLADRCLQALTPGIAVMQELVERKPSG